MKTAPYRIHKLIQDLYRSQADRDAFNVDPEPFFDRAGLTDEEKIAMRGGSLEALTSLGVHPNLHMKYYEIKFGNFGSVAEYFQPSRGK
jgi:hypothetical protein